MNEFLQSDQEDARLREHLKRAVKSEAPSPFLEARIRNRIRTEASKSFWLRRLTPVVAAAIVVAGVVIAYHLGRWRLTTASQESYITSVTHRVATLMRVGLGDHIHCAVFRKLPKDTPKVEDLAISLGPTYGGLVPILRKQLPAEYRLMTAHECRYHDRKFVHLVLKSDSKLLSLVIARKQPGESFAIEGLVPALAESGISFYGTGVQRFHIASFESSGHLVYFISDLDQQHNMQMMLAIAPQVNELLRKVET
jgi:hypothetical protein